MVLDHTNLKMTQSPKRNIETENTKQANIALRKCKKEK